MASFNATREELVFKGGTALNKIHFAGAQRFSEDLDFDFYSIRTRAAAIRFLEEAASALESSGFVAKGVRVIGRREPTFQVECSFDTPLGKQDYVRIDAALKPEIASQDIELATASSSFSGRVVAGVRAYSLDGLVARKLAALANRCEGKDVYDVANGLPMASKGFAGAVGRMLASEKNKLSANGLFCLAASRLRSANPRGMAARTNPFIPLPRRPRGLGTWEAMADSLASRLESLGKCGKL